MSSPPQWLTARQWIRKGKKKENSFRWITSTGTNLSSRQTDTSRSVVNRPIVFAGEGAQFIFQWFYYHSGAAVGIKGGLDCIICIYIYNTSSRFNWICRAPIRQRKARCIIFWLFLLFHANWIATACSRPALTQPTVNPFDKSAQYSFLLREGEADMYSMLCDKPLNRPVLFILLLI